ncbi:MAG: hypothetical protein HQK57_02220, partial [Deltaproteobacteria bacterium]|nr:hypothetical protein [Deltaproteobacteria bacterium]
MNTQSLKSLSLIQQIAPDLGIKLRRTGASTWSGGCPTEHPSESGRCFVVDEKTQLFHCFSCGVSGDVIALVRMILGLNFKSAVGWLADRANLELSGNWKSGKYPKSETWKNPETKPDPDYPILTRPPDQWSGWADGIVNQAHRNLVSDAGQKFRGYLERRGINQKSIERFKIGCVVENHFFNRLEIGLPPDERKVCLPGNSVVVPTVRQIAGQDIVFGM